MGLSSAPKEEVIERPPPGILRLLLVAVITAGVGSVVVGILSFALEDMEAPAPDEVPVEAPVARAEISRQEIVDVVVECHRVATEKDPALDRRVDVVARQGERGVRYELRGRASLYFSGCLNRKGRAMTGELPVPVEVSGPISTLR